MTIKIFVINMLKSTARRELVAAMLDSLGLEYEFFTATDGRNLTPEQEQQCDLQDEVVLPVRMGRKIIVQNKLIPPEVGCAFSHLRLYQHILDCGLDRAVVLEDDVILHPDAVVALQSLDCITEPWDVVHFSSHEGIKNLPFSHKYRFGSHDEFYFQRLGMHHPAIDSIHNQRRVIGLAAFYVVTAHACERLLKLGYPVRIPSDFLLGLIAYNELKMFRAYPLDHFYKVADIASTIGGEEERPHPLVRG